MSKEESITHLRELRRVMSEVADRPPEAFKHKAWGARSRDPERLAEYLGLNSGPPCGTQACVLGHMVLDPYFRDMLPEGIVWGWEPVDEGLEEDSEVYVMCMMQTYDAAHLLGLTIPESNRLFYGDVGYGHQRVWFGSAQEVVDYIDELIERRAE